MKMYFKSYIYRAKEIFISVFLLALSVVLCFVLFGNKLKNADSQLRTYSDADYNIIYILNYEIPVNDLCLYPDTNISMYLDGAGRKRITASAVMTYPSSAKTLDYLSVFEGLDERHIAVSRNISEQYGISVGDTIYLESSDTADMKKAEVIRITNSEYDYSNPIIDNNIGIVFMGYDAHYAENTINKYLLYADSSQTDSLAEYPQIIDSVISKDSNVRTIYGQCIPAFIFEAIFFLAAVIIADRLLFLRSAAILRKLYLKGKKRSILVVMPIIEKLLLGLIPFLTSVVIYLSFPCRYVIAVLFAVMPLAVFVLYLILSAVCSAVKASSRRCMS